MCAAEEKRIYAVGGCNYGRHIQDEQSKPDASMKAALMPPDAKIDTRWNFFCTNWTRQ